MELLSPIALVLLFVGRLVGGQVSIKVPIDQTSTTNKGSTLTIQCESSLDGVVDWLIDGKPINSSLSDANGTKYTTDVVTANRKVVHYLSVHNVTEKDAGSYSCRQMYVATVNIRVSALTAMHVLQPLDNSKTFETGDNFTFVCVGDAAAVIAWYRSSVRLSSGTDDVNITVENDRDHNRQTSVLTRTLVSTDSAAGDYQCRDDTLRLEPSRIVTVYVRGIVKSASTAAHTAAASTSRFGFCATLLLGLLAVFSTSL